MTDDLARTLARLADWLEPRLRADPELRAVVGGVARWVETLGGRAEDAQPAAAEPPPPPPAVIPPPAPFPPPAPPPAAFPAVPIAQLPPLHIHAVYPPPAAHPFPDAERELALLPLAVVAERCRVKGDASRLVARRLETPLGWRDAAAEDAALSRAEALPDCNLWMLNRDPVALSPKTWDDLSGAYAAAADAANLLHAWEQAPAAAAERHASRVLGLAAEAQSVLLYAVADVRDVRMDFDQVQLFAHVRETARARGVFIPKFLKREDRASPESWPDVVRRLAEARAQFQLVGDRDKARAKTLNNLKFKIGRLRDHPDDSAGEWPRVLELVNDLVAGGMPPSNAELRDMLLPVLEDIPDNPPPPPHVGLALREIDRYLETRPDAEHPPARAARPSAEVAEAAELLRGREIVLIGGQSRPLHKAALIRAFGLTDVRWLSTPDHTSFTVFEPDVARPEVAVVLLAIRWSNHDYDGVRAYCEAYHKPLVRLPGGYNANQVAHHILAQAGARLRAATTTLG